MTELAKLRDKYEIIGDVRGKGLMIGVEMVKDKVRVLLQRESQLAAHAGVMCCSASAGGGGRAQCCTSKPLAGAAVSICDP